MIFEKIYSLNFIFENLNILKSWEQIKGANKPVKKTSDKIFLMPEINIKELVSEKFLNKICERWRVPHKKLPKEQIKPYLKWPTKMSVFNLTLPNKNPQNIKPGIWEKLLSKVKESRIRPKNKPNTNPLTDPLIIDQGNNQNNGQYGWTPKNPSQLGCHKKIIGINIKLTIYKLFVKNLFIKYFLSKFAPNQLG